MRDLEESGGDTISTPVAGLGVDIIEIERMERALARTPRMKERIFSETERNYAQGKLRPGAHYALFFAAKEAVLKALGTGFAGMAFTDVEVVHDRFGRPVPILHGRAKELAEKQGVVEMQLSLSYTHSVGVASAVAIKEQDRPRKEKKADPKAELLRQFREVKAILDDMDRHFSDMDEELQETPGETMGGAAEVAMGGVAGEAAGEATSGATGETACGAAEVAMGGASVETAGGASGEAMGGAAEEAMGGASGEAISEAIDEAPQKTIDEAMDDRSPNEQS